MKGGDFVLLNEKCIETNEEIKWLKKDGVFDLLDPVGRVMPLRKAETSVRFHRVIFSYHLDGHLYEQLILLTDDDVIPIAKEVADIMRSSYDD